MRRHCEETDAVPNIEYYDTEEKIRERMVYVEQHMRATGPKKRDIFSNSRYKSLTMEALLLETKLQIYSDADTNPIKKRRLSRQQSKSQESQFLLREIERLYCGNRLIRQFVEQYESP